MSFTAITNNLNYGANWKAVNKILFDYYAALRGWVSRAVLFYANSKETEPIIGVFEYGFISENSLF